MKLPALILTSALFISFTSSANAASGGSSVNVRINNSLNSGNVSSQSFSKTETKVNISQEGEGTSSVTINGKEWKLEGPGEISVNESSDTSPTSGPTSSPTQTPTLTPEPTEEPTPTQSEEPTPTVAPDSEEEEAMTLSEVIRARIENLKKSLQKFFTKFLIFNETDRFWFSFILPNRD